MASFDWSNGSVSTLLRLPAISLLGRKTLDSWIAGQAQETMDQLIKVVNRLQDAFSAVSVSNPIDLPQIVVIGRYVIVCVWDDDG